MRCPRCGMESSKLYQICVYCGAPVQQPVAPPTYQQAEYSPAAQGAGYQPPMAAGDAPVMERPISVTDYLRRENEVQRPVRSQQGFKAALLRLAGVGFKSLSREEKRKTLLELLVLVLVFVGGGPFLLDLLF